MLFSQLMFTDGTVTDVASSLGCWWLSFADGDIGYSPFSIAKKDWKFPFPEDNDIIVKKLASGENFALGATKKNSVVLIKMDDDATTSKFVEWDLTEHCKGPIGEILGMEGSDDFASFLVWKWENEGADSKMPATDWTD